MKNGLVHLFVPWIVFWNQAAPNVHDNMKLQVGISAKAGQCTKLEKKFTVEVARSGAARARGLSNRSTPLKKNKGMLFIFEEPRPVSFWMKDTLIPLQILFFDDRGRLVRSHEMKVEKDPGSPKQNYSSVESAVAALEVAPKSVKDLSAGNTTLCVGTLAEN